MDANVSRRDALRALGAAVVGAAAGGCSGTAPGGRTLSDPPYSPSQEELIAIWTEHNVLVNVTRDESRPGAPVVALSVSLRQVGSKHQIPTGYGVSLYELAQFSELTSLTLSDFSGDELKALAPLQKLTSLTLSWRPTGYGNYAPFASGSGRELKALAPLQKLTSLTLSGYDGKGLKELAPLQNLTRLDLQGCWSIREEDWQELPALKNLTILVLKNQQIWTSTLRRLHEIGLLHVLVGQATTEGGKRAAKPEDVVSLDLCDAFLGDCVFGKDVRRDDGPMELAPLTNLRTLKLARTGLSDKGLKHLGLSRNLTTLDLRGTAVTDVGLKELAALRSLTSLNLRDTAVTDEGLKHLGGCRNLTTLDLRNTAVTGAGLKELASLTNLTEIGLGGTPLTDIGINALAALKKLTALHLSGVRASADIRSTEAAGWAASQVTDAKLKGLVALKNLTAIYLEDTEVTRDGEEELRKALPSCKIRRFGQ